MGKTLIALDLSTAATGWALFDLETKALISSGVIKSPGVPGLKKLPYPRKQLEVMRALANEITCFVNSIGDLERIAIEEINPGANRLSQKTLDGFHYILLDRLGQKIDKVFYKDSDGPTGWRSALKLVLSETDKLINKDRREFNEQVAKGTKKLPIITRKHLACRFVNETYGKQLDVDLRETDADEADAIGLGHAVVHRLTKLLK